MKTLYFGGSILTMDKTRPRAEALLTQDGYIIAVGDLVELEKLSEGSERIDLCGHTLMPSFIDGHGHMSGMGFSVAFRCDLTGTKDFDDMLERIRSFRRERNLVNGEVINCRGYDPNEMKEGKHPNAAVLDRLGFSNPIICVHVSGHMLVCNTIAMNICGITDDYEFPEGGYAQRDENGHLTGYFEEDAKNPILDRFGQYTDEQFEKAVADIQDYYLSRGITTIQDGSGYGADRLACFKRLADSGRLKADVVVYISPFDKELWNAATAKCGNRKYKNRLKIGGIKLMLDGSPQAKTAWLRQPYEGDKEGYCGYPILKDKQVFDILCSAIDYDLQPIAHCNGDAASEQFISAWEQALRVKGKGTSLRPVMVHAQTVGYDQLDRMAAVGMMPSFFVGHCYYWGDIHLKNLGLERGSRISPVKAAIDRGLRYNFHQDSPVTKPEMLHSVWCAVNRTTKSGVCIGEENRIGVYDALIGVTSGGAYSYFEEDTKGVLKAGAVADMVILDKDPTVVPEMEIKNIQVLKAIKDGKVVFDKDMEI